MIRQVGSGRPVYAAKYRISLANFLQAAHKRESAHQSVCSWKGTARYYAAPKDAAKEITGRVAFWKGVTVLR